MMAKFKDPHMQQIYKYALGSHTALYIQGRAGRAPQEAYSRGFRGEKSSWQKNWLDYAFYAAGKENRRLLDKYDASAFSNFYVSMDRGIDE